MADAKIKFKGDATTAFHSGIPARDLATEEYDALDKAQRETVRESPLYDYAGYKAKVDPPKVDPPKVDPPKAPEKPEDPPKDETPTKSS